MKSLADESNRDVYDVHRDNKSYLALYCSCEQDQWKDCAYYRAHSELLPKVCKHYNETHCTSQIALANNMITSLQKMVDGGIIKSYI